MEKIIIHNYRCFELLSLNFKEGVNLFIGDNASGKTTLIRALSTVVSSFFTGFSDENTRFGGLSRKDFRVIESATGLINEPSIKIDFTNLKVNASLELNSKKGRTLQKPLEPIYKIGKTLYDNLFVNAVQNESLPLYASFSTADIHTNNRIVRKWFDRYEHKPSFGYYECLQSDGFLKDWTKRLLILKEAGRGQLEIEGVTNAVKTALGKNGCNIVEDLQVRHNKGEVYYILSDGREVKTDLLSDGLMRIVSIILDLSFRCMLLNKGVFGVDACANTMGTVLIDEIDLHLHPSLQSLVVKGLQNAFPKLQFVITSHSPLVMSGIPANEYNVIYKLAYSEEEGYVAKEVQTYGLDASTIIETVLGVIPRTKDVDDRLNTLFSFIDIDDYIRATNYLNEMKNEFGDNLPELAKAETMLNFLSDSDD